eukprot:1866217-Rhodomonas_salina.1
MEFWREGLSGRQPEGGPNVACEGAQCCEGAQQCCEGAQQCCEGAQHGSGAEGTVWVARVEQRTWGD